ncbi:hypothetical protein [Microbulbifer guangxiensis]|uniref:hypothetical protein n=1 Tax=Microbulbifer guangxiensis TaxID=2904249 RepID=UPI001F3EC0C4|nr:hypothetical protein [Microbulbifer guangxiensis]
MKNLDVSQLQQVDRLVFPDDFCELSLDSPALEFISDFREHSAAVLVPSMSALNAALVMRVGHRNTMLVVDGRGELAGLLGVEDVSHQRLMQWVASGVSRQELTVGDLMRPRRLLKSFSYAQVECSTIGEVLAAMRRDGERDCLVVDTSNHQVRGLISAGEVGLRLHADIRIDDVPNVAELMRSLSLVH